MDAVSLGIILTCWTSFTPPPSILWSDKILALTIGPLQMESQSFCETQDVKDLTVAYKVHAGMCLEFKIGLSSLSCRQAKLL